MVSRLLTLFFVFEFHEYVSKFHYKFLILRRKNRSPVPKIKLIHARDPVWILTFSALSSSTLFHNILGNVNWISFVMLIYPKSVGCISSFGLMKDYLSHILHDTYRQKCHVLT